MPIYPDMNHLNRVVDNMGPILVLLLMGLRTRKQLLGTILRYTADRQQGEV